LLPEELASRQRRVERLQQARGKLEARLKRLEQARKDNAKRSTRQDRKVRSGRKADPEKEKAKQKKDRERQRINLNDPDSHAMPVRKGGFVQGYNAQAVMDIEGANRLGIKWGHVVIFVIFPLSLKGTSGILPGPLLEARKIASPLLDPVKLLSGSGDSCLPNCLLSLFPILEMLLARFDPHFSSFEFL